MIDYLGSMNAFLNVVLYREGQNFVSNHQKPKTFTEVNCSIINYGLASSLVYIVFYN